MAVVIPIAEYVEDKWGQYVNVRITAWMNSVTPAWRGRDEWPVSEECRNAVMSWEQYSLAACNPLDSSTSQSDGSPHASGGGVVVSF